MTHPIRILLAEDQTILRQALQALFEKEQDFLIVSSVVDGEMAVEQAEALRPDVVLIDVEMPGMDGITATQLIRQRCEQTKVLVLSGHDNIRYLSRALRAGAKGYLLKDTPAEDLVNAVRSVYKGYGQFSPSIFEKMTSRMSGREISNGAANGAKPLEPQVVSPETSKPGLAEAELHSLLQSFEPGALSEAIQQTVAQEATVELLERLRHSLEEHPTNLAALYLYGALARRSAEYEMDALPFLRFGFKEGIRQKLSQENLWLFYQEGLLIDPEESLSWLIQPDSPWNNARNLPDLVQEAVQHLGQDSMYVQLLRIRYQLQEMETIQDYCTTLEAKVKGLQQGFERLNRALKG